jgi:pyruvyl transferase EpsO
MVEFRAASALASHQAMMHGLKQRLAGITSVLPPARPIVYLDYPVHENVGDLLIHQGVDAFLEDHGYTVLGRFSMHDFSRLGRTGAPVLKRSIRDLDAIVRRGCTIVLQGGGNIGDIWPQFQAFRELMIARYRETPIVVLPQTVHFRDAAQRRRSARAFAAHRRLFIFVRDRESLAFVREACADGALMPDMAHQLWGRPAFAANDAAAGTLVVRRRDRESRNTGSAAAAHFDWHDLNRGPSRLVMRALRKWQTIDNPLRHLVPNERLWRIYRDRLVSRAVARFEPYAVIDTDRLHGMILGALLSKEVRYSEGSYGKLQRYADLWLNGSGLIVREGAPQAAE